MVKRPGNAMQCSTTQRIRLNAMLRMRLNAMQVIQSISGGFGRTENKFCKLNNQFQFAYLKTHNFPYLGVDGKFAG